MISFFTANWDWNDKISIHLISKLNQYLLKAISDTIGRLQRNTSGKKYCTTLDSDNPACAGISIPKSINTYIKIAVNYGDPSLINMCYIYKYFQQFIIVYNNQDKNFIKISIFEMPYIRENIRRAINFIVNSGINLDNDVEFTEFMNLSGISADMLLGNNKEKELIRETLLSDKKGPYQNILLNADEKELIEKLKKNSPKFLEDLKNDPKFLEQFKKNPFGKKIVKKSKKHGSKTKSKTKSKKN